MERKNLDIQTVLDLPIGQKMKLVDKQKFCEFFDIHKNTFYKWRKTNPKQLNAMLDWYLVFNEDKIKKDEVEN